MAANPVGSPRVYSKEDIQRIGHELIEWCKQPGNWDVSGFEIDTNLPTKFCRNMAQVRKEEFKDLYIRAKEVLGNKLLKKTIETGTDRWVVATLIPKYLSDIDDYLDKKKQRELELAEKAKGAGSTQLDERVVNLLEKMDTHTEANDERKGS